jgi:demethylmenaquinone methyltransferase/2-methoxy-6-polyprenyl-1,4-benzoquinol methylase
MNEYNISRVPHSMESARANYDRLSHWCDLITWSETESIQTGIRMLDVDPGEYILEIGSGIGRALLSLADSGGKTCKVVGVDLSHRMNQVAKRKVNKYSLGNRIKLITGHGTAIPCTPGLFDAIFMSFTLEVFDTPDIPLILQECRSTLQKNGIITVVSLSNRNKSKLAVKLYNWLHTKFPVFIDCRPSPLE